MEVGDFFVKIAVLMTDKPVEYGFVNSRRDHKVVLRLFDVNVSAVQVA